MRLLKIDLVWPLEPERVREFADGLEAIVVVDSRRAWLEEQVRAALYDGDARARVLGQHDERGAPWLARRTEITGGDARAGSRGVARRSGSARRGSRRGSRRSRPRSRARRTRAEPLARAALLQRLSALRVDQLPEGSLAGGGIGCHTMALLMPEREVRLLGAMGSEGAHWIGLAPYTDARHLFQNLGDGTYFHSGRLAVRACVEAGVPITFKLLWNGVVAMTGGQHGGRREAAARAGARPARRTACAAWSR